MLCQLRSSSHAPAKVNLTLRVLGRRADGYHDIESVVVFAAAADRLGFVPGGGLALTLRGPTAGLTGTPDDNLVLKAARALSGDIPGLTLGRFQLDKRLPVAAGLGGGSADAAAALRLLARANRLKHDDPRLYAAARATGADVPVCLDPRPRLMRGIGEVLSAPLALPSFPAVLVNPGVAVPTREVFAALRIAASPHRATTDIDALAQAAHARRGAGTHRSTSERSRSRRDRNCPGDRRRTRSAARAAGMQACPHVGFGRDLLWAVFLGPRGVGRSESPARRASALVGARERAWRQRLRPRSRHWRRVNVTKSIPQSRQCPPYRTRKANRHFRIRGLCTQIRRHLIQFAVFVQQPTRISERVMWCVIRRFLFECRRHAVALHGAFGDFRRATAGNVAITFGLLLIPLVGGVGTAVDYSNALRIRTWLQAAADAASIGAIAYSSAGFNAAAGMSKDGSVSSGVTDGKNLFNGQISGKTGFTLNKVTVKVNRKNGAVTSSVTYAATVPTTFLGIFKIAIDPAFGNVEFEQHAAELHRFLSAAGQHAVDGRGRDAVRREQDGQPHAGPVRLRLPRSE